MAAPNILNISTITSKTALASLTTVTSSIIINSSGSNSVLKLNNILLTNYSTSAVTATISISRSSNSYILGGNIAIPANSTLVLLGKDTSIYIEEGDIVQANTSANSSVNMTASYDIIS
jgi:hypothetical protein